MAEAVLDSTEVVAVEAVRRRGWRLWLSRLAKFVVGALIGLALALAAFIAFLDTSAGHRFIVDRIAAMTPKSGLRIRIGRIDGSIWGRTQLRDVRLYDPQGLFAESSEIEHGLAAARFPVEQPGHPRAGERPRHPSPPARAEPARGAAAAAPRLRHPSRPGRRPPAADRRAGHRTRAHRQPDRRGRDQARPGPARRSTWRCATPDRGPGQAAATAFASVWTPNRSATGSTWTRGSGRRPAGSPGRCWGRGGRCGSTSAARGAGRAGPAPPCSTFAGGGRRISA